MSKIDIIYGYQPVLEAINSGKEIEKILFQKTIQQNKITEIKSKATGFNIPFQFVPKERLNKFTRKNHQGIIAIVSPVTYENIENLLPSLFEEGKIPFLLILDKITDVRNLGAIARSAECAGVDAIIIPSRGSAIINADGIKTSAGALNKIPVCRNPNLKETIQFLKNSGLKIVGATEKTEKNFYTINYNDPLALIMGSEEKGISGEYIKLCDETVKIPMVGEIQSLNVAVASGIVLFEVVRQRISN